MKLIFCIEKGKGIMFFGKRVSKDRLLNARLLEIVGQNKLFVSEYSASLFEGAVVDNDYLTAAGQSDYCFVEDRDYNLEKTSEIILCNFNRKYPADKFFDIDLKANGFKKILSEDIVGSSHDKITIETYRRG